jgi:hypothetical protein
MATKTDFTEGEWESRRKGVSGAGLLVSLSDRDLTDTFGEVGAMAKYISGQSVASSSQLVRDLSHGGAAGFGLTASPDKVRAETMAALTTSVATLTAKAPDELAAYRELVLGVAAAVAQSKSGEAPVEASMIGEIRTALGAG